MARVGNFGSTIGEALGLLLRPITRPLWLITVRARSPWPLVLMLLVGVASVLGSFKLMTRDTPWGAIGLLLFFAGAALTLLAPLLWRDARAEAVSRDASRPVI